MSSFDGFNPHPDPKKYRQDKPPIHFAAKNCSDEMIKLLIEKGASPNAIDAAGRTPLHIISGRNMTSLTSMEIERANNCMEILLGVGADPNTVDSSGMTALHYASLQSQMTFSNLLIKNGANIYIKESGSSSSALELLVKHCHKSLIKALDECIVYEPSLKKNTNTQHLNWRVNLDFLHKGGMNIKNLDAGQRTKALKSPVLKELVRIRDEAVADRLDVDEGTNKPIKKILQHPVTQMYMHVKWASVKGFYYILVMLFHLIYSVIYTGYTIINFRILCEPKDQFNREWHSFDVTGFFHYLFMDDVICVHHENFKTTHEATFYHMIENVYPHYGKSAKLLWILLPFFTGILILREITKIISAKLKYFTNPDNYLVMIIVCSFFLCMHHKLCFYSSCSKDYHLRWYQYHAAAIGTWATWMEMMLLTGKTPRFGVYVEMIRRVTRSIVHLLVAYMFIFVAFTTSFYLLFPSHFEYQSNLFVAMTKVLYQFELIQCFHFNFLNT